MVDDGRTTDGRTTEHGYTISSPCEPDGSGELKTEASRYLERCYAILSNVTIQISVTGRRNNTFRF